MKKEYGSNESLKLMRGARLNLCNKTSTREKLIVAEGGVAEVRVSTKTPSILKNT